MKAAVYARILLALLCLLALATSASAEGARVSWERTNIEPTTQRRIEAFSTQRECQTAALREARFKYVQSVPPADPHRR